MVPMTHCYTGQLLTVNDIMLSCCDSQLQVSADDINIRYEVSTSEASGAMPGCGRDGLLLWDAIHHTRQGCAQRPCHPLCPPQGGFQPAHQAVSRPGGADHQEHSAVMGSSAHNEGQPPPPSPPRRVPLPFPHASIACNTNLNLLCIQIGQCLPMWSECVQSSLQDRWRPLQCSLHCKLHWLASSRCNTGSLC